MQKCMENYKHSNLKYRNSMVTWMYNFKTKTYGQEKMLI